MNYLRNSVVQLRNITDSYSSFLKPVNHRIIKILKYLRENWILRLNNNSSNLTFDLYLGPLSVSLLTSFLCLEMIPRQCVHELISLFLFISQVPSPAHLSQPLSLQDTPLVLDLIERSYCLGWRWGCGDRGRGSEPAHKKWVFIFFPSSSVPVSRS